MGRGRPPLPLGTFGEISVTAVAGGQYKARARYRDRTGQLRMVARFGETKKQAERRLKEALADWQHDQGQGLHRGTTLTALARDWFADVEADPRKATNTLDTYRIAVERYVIPYVGSVRIGEADAGVIDAALKRIATDKGPSSARTTRSVLTGMFALATRHGAVTANPVRETRRITTESDLARALTITETKLLVETLAADEVAIAYDLPDLFDAGLATGCRIGEAIAFRDTVLDLEAGTVEINGTVIRIKGIGLAVQERPKSAAGWRVLALPEYFVEILQGRRERVQFNPPAIRYISRGREVHEAPGWVAFPSPRARALRDGSNTAGDLREALDRAGFDWVTFKTCRKTVATRMDEAGCTPREIADQLGHSHPSMTQDVYMGRRVVSAAAAKILGRAA